MKLLTHFLALLTITAICKSSYAINYSYAPVNLAAKKLPREFAGTPCLTLCSFLGERKITKGRYETSAAFENRLDKLNKRPLVDKIYMWSPVGVGFRANWCDYDADTQQFSAHFVLFNETSYFNGDSSIDYLAGVTDRTVDYQGTYRAQNGFGAETDVYTSRSTAYGLAVLNKNQFPFVRMDDLKCRVSYATKIPPSSAAKLEKNIRVLYVGYLTTPYTLKDYSGESATFNSPVSSANYFNFVCLRVKQVWFYDYTTGYIFAKMKG